MNSITGTYAIAVNNANEKLCMAMHINAVPNSMDAMTQMSDIFSYFIDLEIIFI